MTDEYALRLAEKWAQGYVCSLRDGEAQEYHKACAAALQEREERSKGCEFCTEKWTDSGKTLVEYISDGEWLYCPMCGRKLKTATPGEEQHG